jgi:hypothetical protein
MISKLVSISSLGCIALVVSCNVAGDVRTDEPATASAASHLNERSQPTLFASGSRLKVEELTGDDGSVFSSVLLGSSIGTGTLSFHDTLFDVTCRPSTASDGRVRCLPEVGSLLGLPNGPTAEFSDSTCTNQVITPVNLTGGRFVGRFEHGTVTYLDVGDIYSGPVYIKDPFSDDPFNPPCIPTTVPAGSILHSVGAQHPPTDFVGFTRHSAH